MVAYTQKNIYTIVWWDETSFLSRTLLNINLPRRRNKKNITHLLSVRLGFCDGTKLIKLNVVTWSRLVICRLYKMSVAFVTIVY